MVKLWYFAIFFKKIKNKYNFFIVINIFVKIYISFILYIGLDAEEEEDAAADDLRI